MPGIRRIVVPTEITLVSPDTGEVLPAGRFSMSAYRVNFDHTEGFTDVSNE